MFREEDTSRSPTALVPLPPRPTGRAPRPGRGAAARGEGGQGGRRTGTEGRGGEREGSTARERGSGWAALRPPRAFAQSLRPGTEEAGAAGRLVRQRFLGFSFYVAQTLVSEETETLRVEQLPDRSGHMHLLSSPPEATAGALQASPPVSPPPGLPHTGQRAGRDNRSLSTPRPEPRVPVLGRGLPGSPFR